MSRATIRLKTNWRASAWSVGLLALLTFAACKTTKRHAEVEGVLIAQADALLKVPDGATIAIAPGSKLETLPDDENIRLAIARDVLWSDVRDMRKEILRQGKVPHLLVASGNRVGGLQLYQELKGEAIDVVVSVGGKLCVSPPETPEAKCVQRADKKHVDRSFTRELVREAVKGYHLQDVLLVAPPDIEWADLARAVDGARTCCFETKVRVRLK